MDGAGTAGASTIAGYTGLVELGRTPAALTYAATDATGRPVVLKVLLRDAAPEVRARFDYDQARLQELLDHPDIVNTIDHGYTDANQPYLVMEHLAGGSMAARVGSGMDGPGVLAIGVKIAGALESAHRRNLVHGDLRPEDILVTDDGEPHIADLGVAMVTGIGPDRSTDPTRIAHAAPEQLESHLPTTASDVYGLGSVLYALLAGSPAFVRPGDTTATAVALRIAGDPAPDLRPTGVPEAVIDVIDKAMAKDPAARWGSAEAMGIALQQAQVSLGLPITPMTILGADRNPDRASTSIADEPVAAAPAPGPKGGKKTGLLVGVGVLLVAALGGVGFVVLGGDDGGDDGEDPPPFQSNNDPAEFDLVEVSDASGTITVEVLEKWGGADNVDGRPLTFSDAGVSVPDLVASVDPATFLDAFDDSGLELTVFDDVALEGLGRDADAAALLQLRAIVERDLADQCSLDLPADAFEIDGFDGLLQLFEECDGSKVAVFAGIDADGRALVVEAHLVDAEDEEALEQVLESIQIA